MIVIDELANFEFAIDPANIAFVTLVFGSVTVLLDKSNVLASLAVVIVPGVISASTIVPSSILSAFIESSVNPDLVTFVSAILTLFHTIYIKL